ASKIHLITDANVTRKLLGLNSAQHAKQLAGGSAIGFSVAGSGINNNGGWIIDGKPVHVYLIWYGNWSGSPALSVIPNFISGLNGTDYMNILTTYWGRDAQVGGAIGFVSNHAAFGGPIFDWYSHGLHLH